MVELAGGLDVLGEAGRPSREATWDEVARAEPEIAVAMPCGFGLERAMRELSETVLPDSWHALPAVQNGRVFAVDGSSYFNRPGPRLVTGVEILASILHPDAFPKAPEGSVAPFMTPLATRIRY
jgi:iron complex transport system substrate-binding protein